MNLEHYPADPNALFYLGEGCWDDGQKETAIQILGLEGTSVQMIGQALPYS